MQTTLNRILVVTAVAWELIVPVCAQAASSLPAGTVAIVDGTPITDADVLAVLQAKKQQDTVEARDAIKNRLIAHALIRQAAEKAGYGNKPDVLVAMQAAKVRTEEELYLSDSVNPEPVTDAQVEAHYEQYAASFGKFEYKLQFILFKDASAASTVLDEIKAGKPFDLLAREYSIVPSRDANGELPWINIKLPVTNDQASGSPPEIACAVEKLRVGETELVPITTGGAATAAIVKLEAKRPTQVPAFDQVRAELRQKLHALAFEKASAQFAKKLLETATIEQ